MDRKLLPALLLCASLAIAAFAEGDPAGAAPSAAEAAAQIAVSTAAQAGAAAAAETPAPAAATGTAETLAASLPTATTEGDATSLTASGQPPVAGVPTAQTTVPAAEVAGSAAEVGGGDELPTASEPRRLPRPLLILVLGLPEPKLPPLPQSLVKAQAIPPASPAPAASTVTAPKPAPAAPAAPSPAPVTAKPATDKPATDKPATDKPATDKPAGTAAAKPATASSATAATAGKPATATTAKPATTATTAKPATDQILLAPSPPSTALSLLPASAPSAATAQPRTLSVEAGSRFELPFEGTGWTYLGDKNGREGILYDSRRFEGAGVVFSLKAPKAGEYLLRFQKQDAMRGLAYDELVSVTVSAPKPAAAPSTPLAATATSTTNPSPATTASTSPSPTASGTGEASKGAAAGPAKPVSANASQLVSANAPIAAVGGPAATSSQATSPQTTAPLTSPAADAAGLGLANPALAAESPEGLLAAARAELAAGRPKNALEALDLLAERRPEGMDELYFLYGKALEQSGPLRDIRRAYDSYKRLRDGYPQSRFWDEAAERVAYIERHYLEIR